MTRKNVNKILLLFVLLLSVVACSTKKSIATVSVEELADAKFVASSPAATSSRECLSGNAKLSLSIGDKQLSSTGTIRIKQNEGVQIGISPLGIIEVASIEFFPGNARLIYKLGKEYADVSYSSVPFLERSGIDYHMLEALLMNKIFIPILDESGSLVKGATLVREGGELLAKIIRGDISYTFAFEQSTGNLVSCKGLHKSGVEVLCRYANFEALEGTLFPRTITISISGVEPAVSLSFKLSNLKTADFNFSPRKISTSYDKIPIETLIKSLGNI